MSNFNRRNGRLFAEDVPLETIAEQIGTPCYVYSRAALEQGWRAYDRAFGDHPHSVCFAVKANSNLAVLDVLARLGAGFDIVSGGELERVLQAGGEPRKVVFSGVAKGTAELARALEVGVGCIDVESAAELERVNTVAARLGVLAPVALRINPDVDAETHPYIATGLNEAKFGIPIAKALDTYQRAAALPHIAVHGLASHIGSQIVSVAPYTDALDRLLGLIPKLAAAGIPIAQLDLGGGLGICYRDESPPSVAELVAALLTHMRARDCRLPVTLEPGRSIAAPAGVLLTRVEYLKTNGDRHFAVVDAGMNDLLRPALYDAWHDIVPVTAPVDGKPRRYDVVGPVCETGDVLGRDRDLALTAGMPLAVMTAGAYGFVMSSTYNSRPRPAEVMVDGDAVHLIRRRETVAELWEPEFPLPD